MHSLNPLGSREKAIVDQDLLGVWYALDETGKPIRESYLVVTSSGGSKGCMRFVQVADVGITKCEGFISVVNGERYINFPVQYSPEAPNATLGMAFLVNDPTDFYGGKGHYVFLCYSIDPSSVLGFSAFNEDFFKEAVQGRKLRGKLYSAGPWNPYDSQGNPAKATKDVYVKLTCTTEELVRFLAKHDKAKILVPLARFKKMKE